MKKYIDDDRLWYEIKLSQGKGFVTTNLALMFIKIAKNMINIKPYFYPMDKDDAYQVGLLRMFLGYKNFNCKKYRYALPYMSELFKRGMCEGFNQIHNRPENISINYWLDKK